jgi:hypothetical protein
MREYLFILGLFAGFAFAHWAPIRIKRRHVKAQESDLWAPPTRPGSASRRD